MTATKRLCQVNYQPKYQARYQPEGRACRAARRLIPGICGEVGFRQRLMTKQIIPERLVLYLLFLEQWPSK